MIATAARKHCVNLGLALLINGFTLAAPKYGPDWSRLLHVVVFAERSNLLGDDVRFDVIKRDSADFPVKFSRILHDDLSTSGPELTALDLPPSIILDDLYTFEMTDDFVGSGEPVRRRNPFTELEYFLQVEDWSEASYDITLRGRVRRNGFKGIKTTLPRDRTSIVRISDWDRLYFAFTPLGSVDFGPGLARVGEAGVKTPVPVKQTIPGLPAELINRKVTGRSKTWMVLLGIVGESGVFDRENFILAECPHFSFAERPVGQIFEDWELQPAQRGGRPVASVVSLELEFALK